MGRKYGYTATTGKAAASRATEILRTLSAELSRQRERGSRFFIGDALSATDLHWAPFAAMVEPLPSELCPIPDGLRAGYTVTDPEVLAAADPILLEHRDFIYREFIGLPVDL